MLTSLQSPELKQIGDRYICPECSATYTWTWIRRHLVKNHGYKYFKGLVLYKPQELSPQQKGNKDNE